MNSPLIHALCLVICVGEGSDVALSFVASCFMFSRLVIMIKNFCDVP